MKILVSVGIGAAIGVISMFLQIVLSPESRAKRVLACLNSPVDHAITWYARICYSGNTDQLIPQGMWLWCMYWLSVGVALGLAGYGICRYFATNRGA
jgi:hypothetical protein